ncbi:hypothetical protein SCNRRL3882_5343 [Streptomyces chartreusis NRRL 3882]|uniref:Uncharacterized protein n=1 Tax=Streptomyces chartreusis NRRL 3882 TaxID=1079985 RepID=A0A2N9BEY0_STRCX|nr:hypothetical protein SCNRRL3882_5343 [Streptomyces chartreusis NRRL 3882]
MRVCRRRTPGACAVCRGCVPGACAVDAGGGVFGRGLRGLPGGGLCGRLHSVSGVGVPRACLVAACAVRRWWRAVCPRVCFGWRVRCMPVVSWVAACVVCRAVACAVGCTACPGSACLGRVWWRPVRCGGGGGRCAEGVFRVACAVDAGGMFGRGLRGLPGGGLCGRLHSSVAGTACRCARGAFGGATRVPDGGLPRPCGAACRVGGTGPLRERPLHGASRGRLHRPCPRTVGAPPGGDARRTVRSVDRRRAPSGRPVDFLVSDRIDARGRTATWQGQGRPWARPAGSSSRSGPPR